MKKPRSHTARASVLDMPTARVFAPLLGPCRYKGAYGGRGSGKSHFFGECVVEEHLRLPGHRTVCIREVQKSMERSSRQLIIDKIEQHNLHGLFDIQDRVIRTPGDGIIIFQGMQAHTADSIKSLEGFDRAWVEEAQSLSAHSWRLLRPTLRKAGSEIWASWNPTSAQDAVDAFFRGAGSDRADLVAVRANWADNPWFSTGTLEAERQADARTRPEEYDHIWEGAYRTVSDALVFAGHVQVRAFETPDSIRPYYGVDWGFAKDPLAALRCWIEGGVLYIDYEAGGQGIELDRIPAVLDTVPGARQWPWKADGARPETIRFLARHYGFKITAARKWPGSVEDGIARLKTFERIVVHPRCVRVAAEFRQYAYRVDPHTDDILPVVADAHNHWMDALRYALDGLIHNRRGLPRFTADGVRSIVRTGQA
ncbi:MAG: PBSX family phage terminase large subunit [Acetobacter sp.]|uniref:PBSX family phage terminase large subunit n=1 Tax=Acetobacter sp. TaxID=440 RepID=UPI0039E87C8F